jgi:hypothetical protein
MDHVLVAGTSAEAAQSRYVWGDLSERNLFVAEPLVYFVAELHKQV